MICHPPSAARTEIPIAAKADLLCQVERQVDGGQQWLGVAEVRALVEVDAFQRQVIRLTELRGLHDFLTSHAELAVVLAGLGMRVMSVDSDAGEEAKPEIYVTLREWHFWCHDRRVSSGVEEILTCTGVRCQCRFAQDDMHSFELC